jgi:hypothetical protein
MLTDYESTGALPPLPATSEEPEAPAAGHA